MTEKENKLIEDLFKQAAQQQIEDNGFTEKVMEAIGNGQWAIGNGQLKMDNGQWAIGNGQWTIENGQLKKDNGKLLSMLWTWFCIAVSLVLFFVFNGWEMLKASLHVLYASILTSFEVFLTTAPTAEFDLNPWMILLALGFVSIYLPYRTARKLSAIL
jgi:hypothetical protein